MPVYHLDLQVKGASVARYSSPNTPRAGEKIIIQVTPQREYLVESIARTVLVTPPNLRYAEGAQVFVNCKDVSPSPKKQKPDVFPRY